MTWHDKKYQVVGKDGWKHHIIRENSDCGERTCCGLRLPHACGRIEMTADEYIADEQACIVCLESEGL